MDVTNPWKTLESKRIYENPWISIKEDQVIQPDGKPGIYGTVHFKNKAIGVLPIDDQGYTYLVGQYRYPLDEYSWEIPEGGSPIGESALGGAKRELLEETGLRAREWRLLGTAHLSNSVSDEVALWYLATGLSQGDSCPEGTEKLEPKRVPFKEALNMVKRGLITDALSVLAIQSYALWQHSGEDLPPLVEI
jgi:8-oxo-dGTP pyrophosphatase MutT (NUDIX family)